MEWKLFFQKPCHNIIVNVFPSDVTDFCVASVFYLWLHRYKVLFNNNWQKISQNYLDLDNNKHKAIPSGEILKNGLSIFISLTTWAYLLSETIYLRLIYYHCLITYS